MRSVDFIPPRDSIRISTNDDRVLSLADRLWSRTPELPNFAAPIVMQITISALGRRQAIDERHIVWSHERDSYAVSFGDLAAVRIDLTGAAVEATAAEEFVAAAPDLASRTLLEAPAAVLLARRAYSVLHAAAVVGPRGAVVIRGASGAGKSTLTAAAWRAGFGVLADESLLVARDDHDDLAACVRDLTLLPNSVRLLGLEDTERAFSGGEEKRRINLFRSSVPANRRARRLATILLGERERAPARLTPLHAAEFQAEFRRGTIPEEWTGGSPEGISASWARANAYRLDGSIDLDGAVAMLRSICG